MIFAKKENKQVEVLKKQNEDLKMQVESLKLSSATEHNRAIEFRWHHRRQKEKWQKEKEEIWEHIGELQDILSKTLARERAAVEDLKTAVQTHSPEGLPGECFACKHFKGNKCIHRLQPQNHAECWEWRGPQKSETKEDPEVKKGE